MQQDSSLRTTLIGFVVVLLLYVGYYPVWLFVTTYTDSQPTFEEQFVKQTKIGRADIARTNTALVYRNNIIYKECEQGCEAINFRWKGAKYRDKGTVAIQPCLEMYFSSYELKTDSILPNNRLVMYMENGDSIALHAMQTYRPSSIGYIKRRYFCHAYRESSYAPLTKQDISLLSSYQIVSMKIESYNYVLVKTITPEYSQSIIQRLAFIKANL